MLATSAPSCVTPGSPVLDRVRELYDRGLFLQAHRQAESLGPLASWRGTAARLLAGRLALYLGATRLATWHLVWAWRQDRADLEACSCFAYTRLSQHGPWAAWNFLRRVETPVSARPKDEAVWLALHASVLGCFRDFEAAETWLERADRACPEDPWTFVERAHLFEMEDRFEDALAAIRHALQLRPLYHPAVLGAGHLLQQLGRDRESLDLLTEADEQMESGPVAAMRALLHSELGHHRDARKCYARYAEFSPLAEKDAAQWLAARRCDSAYEDGDFAEAADFARQVDAPGYQRLAEMLTQDPSAGKRVVLEVGFVRQHYQTCVPATVATLSRFWQIPCDHSELAAAICYKGTPNHHERRWVECHGWRVREFTVTWESAAALLDRRIPFALTTSEPTNAHAQAVIGYDTRKNSLLIRDPSMRYLAEYPAEPLFERYRSTGPRGMALVPLERAGLLDSLELPDADRYDILHRLQCALEEHDRAAAASAYDALRTEAPDHRLTLEARRVLATYDADQADLLASIERMLLLFPADPLLERCKLDSLRFLGRRDLWLMLLRDICARGKADPVFRSLYAQELAGDAREHATAVRLLRWTLRVRPAEASHYAMLADLLWNERRFDSATELYRFAACLDDKNESLARLYFLAARHLKQTDKTLRFLERRCERFGQQASQPARTLFWAYAQLERGDEAFAVLEKTLDLPAAHPDVGRLWIELCLEHKRWRRLRRLDGLLDRGEIGRRAMVAYLEGLGLARRTWRLDRCIRRFRPRLRKDPYLWGTAGYALLMCGAHRRTIRWLADWAGRDDVKPWMLINLVLALRTLGHLDEAAVAGRHALSLPEDHTSGMHKLWRALDAVLSGATTSAAADLGKIDPRQLDTTHRFVHALVKGVIGVQQAQPEERLHALRKAFAGMKRVAPTINSFGVDRSLVLRTYHRGLRRLARDCGTWRAKLLCLWKVVVPVFPG